MADIITRLLLKTNDFDANLNKAKGSVNQFQGGISNMAKTAGAGMMKFAGTIGIAVGAYEAFDKAINSSQSTGDAWVKMQDQMKASVDSFFASIAMGNLDGFTSNLQNVIDKAGELSVALDNLGTKTLFNNGEVDDLNTKYQIALNKAKARNISDEERNKYLNEARGYLIEITKLQMSLSNANKETSYTALQAEMAKQGFDRNISKDVWEYLLKDSNRADIDARAAEYNNTVGGYKNKLAHPYDPKTGEWLTQREADELEKELRDYEASKRGNFNRMASIFVQLADDEKSMIKKALDMRKASNALSVSVSQKELEVANTDAKINGSYKTNNGAGSNNSTPPPVGSLAAIDAEISKLNKKLAEATTMQARAAVQATINELEQQKINLKIVVDQEAFKIKYGEMKGGSLGAPGSIYEALQNNAGNKKQGSFDLRKELPNMKLPKFKSPIKKADINLNEEYAASLNSIGSIMGSLSGTFDGGAASVLQWGASIFSTVAQVIPLLNALTEANEIETKSEVKGAVGKTMNAHAKIPFVGIAMGLAGVASIFSVMSQASKFATGGIVPGNSFTGDKVPAWVNSGEMILNSEQQSNLFKMLNSKLYGGLNIGRPNIEPQTGNIAALIAPGDNGRDIRVSGDVKVKGSDLYLSLDNYKKKTGKK